MRSILCIGFVVWSVVSQTNSTHKPLIFNFQTSTLIHLPSDLTNLDCNKWMITCPANNEREQKFNEKYSANDSALFFRALFFRTDYDPPLHCEDLKSSVCKNPYKISMVLLPHGKFYEFGYEVYINDEKIELPSITYYPMKEFRRNLLFEENFGQKIDKMIKERYEKKFELEGTQINYTLIPNSIMNPFWIPLVRVKFHLTNFRYVEYEIRGNNINPRLPCKDESLGKEIIPPSLVNNLYTKEIQKKIFNEVKLPIRESETAKYPEGACSPENECLIKWPLLPTDQYQFDSDSPVICSNLTTIPIWKSTLEMIMDKLDRYLYALHRLSGQALRIQAGVHKILSLPQESTLKWRKEIKLEDNGVEIETPNLIYKMVKFKLEPCETKQNQNCWYGVLIVIHNGPYRPKVGKDLICYDQSGILGWEEIRYQTRSDYGAQSQFIYVCEITKTTVRSVGLPHIKDITFEPLSLLNFPFLNENNELKFKSLKGELFEEMKRLSKPGAEVKLDDVVMERPFLNYNFGYESKANSISDRIRRIWRH